MIELGTFSAIGYNISSVTLTQTATLSWSLVETKSSGQKVQNLSGSSSVAITSNGAAPFDPFFTQGLSNLTANSQSVTETNGSDSYTFRLTNAVATVQDTVKQPLTRLPYRFTPEFRPLDYPLFTLYPPALTTYSICS